MGKTRKHQGEPSIEECEIQGNTVKLAKFSQQPIPPSNLSLLAPLCKDHPRFSFPREVAEGLTLSSTSPLGL